MQDSVATPAVFITITDVRSKAHVETVFFGSLLERQLAEGKIRDKYSDAHFVIAAHPTPDQVRICETTDVFYQANMQSLILGSLNRPRSM